MICNIKTTFWLILYGWLPAFAVHTYYQFRLNKDLSWVFGIPALVMWFCFFAVFIYYIIVKK